MSSSPPPPNASSHHAKHQSDAVDVELAAASSTNHDVPDDSKEPGSSSSSYLDDLAVNARTHRWLRKYERYMLATNLEARGIRRVEPHERHDTAQLGYAQISMMWFSLNFAAQNLTLGMLGPIVFSLSFRDAALCAVFGQLLGSVPAAYVATFGPRSGHRTLVFARYIMGYYPAKLIVVLNLIILLGYALISSVIAGQLLSAVSPHASLSVVVGIVIVALITWTVSTFGYRLFHVYERYAWIPMIVVYAILAGVAGPHFDLATPSAGDAHTRVGDRLSFFGLCLAAAITYAGCAADYCVYYPERSPRWRVFAATLLGLCLSFSFALLLGAGLGSGTTANPSWAAAYATSQGALVVAAFAPLGPFGHFCAVAVALGLIANLLSGTYSAALNFQVLGGAFLRVPRVLWNTAAVVIYAVCALAGREHLADIFTNFLAIMGYWVSVFVAIVVEEHALFRRRRGFDWTAWEDPGALPVGIAAMVAFLVGWAGAIVSMAQVWYIGPIAKLVGANGADMGNYVGFAWAALVYPPLRYVELRKFGR